ncbi:hypothetical protein [Vibrio maerlii]|uniref:hypothetical protein n=1 Tax=Vibrio maerlii TaxID=2231648 RepID=UPI000F5076A6|nr:hypothetical protein [Vibrio maerlii]
MFRTLLVLSLCFSEPILALESWNSHKRYSPGERVFYQDIQYVSTHWNLSNAPKPSNTYWDGWLLVEAEITRFNWGSDYDSGDVVEYYGDIYLAKWGNRNELPAESWYWRRLASDDYLNVTGISDVDRHLPHSVEFILGEDINRNHIKDRLEFKVLHTYPSTELQRLALNASFVYRALHQLELDESINLLEQEVISLFAALSGWQQCMQELGERNPRIDTPWVLYHDTLYSSLLYQLGQNEALQDLNGEFEKLNDLVAKNYCEDYDLATLSYTLQ